MQRRFIVMNVRDMSQIKNIFKSWVEKMDKGIDVEITVRTERERGILVNTFKKIYPDRDDLKKKLRTYVTIDKEQGIKQ